MKKFTITIPDNKESIFIEMMKNISFVKKIEAATNIDNVEENNEIVSSRDQKMEDNPESCLSWEEIEKNLQL